MIQFINHANLLFSQVSRQKNEGLSMCTNPHSMACNVHRVKSFPLRQEGHRTLNYLETKVCNKYYIIECTLIHLLLLLLSLFLCLQELSKINELVCALFNEYSRLSVTLENLSENDSLSTNLTLLVLISEKILKDSCKSASMFTIAIYSYVVCDVCVCAGGD